MDIQILLQYVADNVSDAVYIKDLEGKYLFLNRASESIIGKPASDVINKDDYYIFEKSKADIVREHDKKIISEINVQTFDESVVAADGVLRSYHSTKGPIIDSKGHLIGIFGVSHDITDQKNLEQKLENSITKWRRLFNILPVGVSILDEKGEVIDLNQTLCDKLKISKDELTSGKHRQRRYIRNDGSPMPKDEFPSARALAEKRNITHVVIGVVTEKNETIWTDVSASPLEDSHGVVIVTEDITAQKQLREQLEEKILELERMNSFMVGRELKMSELKQEIADLKQKSSQ